MICPKCGEKNEDNAKFCTKCGAKLEEVKNYSEYELHRLDVKGGLLCYWQITKNRHNVILK